MTRFYLIRHATHGLPDGSLPARTPGIFLSPDGKSQAANLANSLAAVSFDALYTSPLERTRQTADAIATQQLTGTRVEICDALSEVDYGAWTGKTVAELSATDPAWTPYNAYRSGTAAPDGESILDVQARATREIARLRHRHGNGATIALVSHADVIRALLCHFLAVPLDLLLRFSIAPASVSIVDVGDWGPQVVCVNNTQGLP